MDCQFCGGDRLGPRFVSISVSGSRTSHRGFQMAGMNLVIPDTIIVGRDGVRNPSILSKLVHLLTFVSATINSNRCYGRVDFESISGMHSKETPWPLRSFTLEEGGEREGRRSIHFRHFGFLRLHGSTRTRPAMAAGVKIALEAREIDRRNLALNRFSR